MDQRGRAWRILRNTGGRPKPLPGPDSQSARFGLEMTHEDLLELCGPGKYRIEALDEFGNVLGCLRPSPSVARLRRRRSSSSRTTTSAYAGNDLRIAMETITQLTRANAESLQTLANAQADWIKTLATSKSIPRNASAPMFARRAHRRAQGWLARPSRARDARDRDRALLAPEERKLFDRILLDETVAEPLVTTLCERDVAAGAAFIREKIKATPTKRRLLPSFDEHVTAVCALLPPEERAAATTLLNDWIRPPPRTRSCARRRPRAPSERKEIPTVRTFSKTFIETSQIKNKPSSVDAKNAILTCHLLPLIGDLTPDRITYAVIEDLKLALAKETITRVDPKKLDAARKRSPKTVNNCLVVLRRMLVVARKRGLIKYIPDVEWLKSAQPEFDFLDFEEADP